MRYVANKVHQEISEALADMAKPVAKQKKKETRPTPYQPRPLPRGFYEPGDFSD
jgi:hypothetical protein